MSGVEGKMHIRHVVLLGSKTRSGSSRYPRYLKAWASAWPAIERHSAYSLRVKRRSIRGISMRRVTMKADIASSLTPAFNAY